LEEVAVLRIVQKNPSATQKEIAAEIGKSERTVKSITIALQEKNILQRVNGKRNGYWSIVDERLKVQYIVNLKKKPLECWYHYLQTRGANI
jgi:DNA-binding Lrp family transcriptional regulator